MARRRQMDPAAGAEGGLIGGAERLRNVIARKDDPQRQERHRDEWPELWDTIDGIVQCVDALRGPWRPPPAPSLFDGGFTRIPPPR